MGRFFVSIVFLFVLGAQPSFAQRKGCEELKAEISRKMDSNGVKNYTLTIVPAADVKPGDNVVGSCDGGSRRVVYKRG